MNFLIIFLTFLLMLTCLFLVLLVLVQLPKKEAGLGQAFGSGATDALFGPVSGNMLTKLTKWTAGTFFALTLLIWIMQGHNARATNPDLRQKLTPAEKAAADAARNPPPAPLTNQGTNLQITLPTNAANATNLAKPTNVPPANPPAPQ